VVYVTHGLVFGEVSGDYPIAEPNGNAREIPVASDIEVGEADSADNVSFTSP